MKLGRRLWCILTFVYLTSIASQVRGEVTQVTTLLRSDFSADEDKNGDGWPDAWNRVFDREHPKYISISTQNRVKTDLAELQQVRRSIAQLVLAFEQGRRPGDVVPERIPPKLDAFLDQTLMNRCLEIQMDGGSALIESHTFPIDRRYTYRFSAEMLCDQLDDFTAQFTLVGLDSSNQEVILGNSSKLSGTRDWTPIRINNVVVHDSNVSIAKLRLEVRPSNFHALHGTVKLDTVRVLRLPKLTVSASPQSQVIEAGQALNIKCEVTGLDRPVSRVQFLVRDADGQTKEKHQFDVHAVSHPAQSDDQYIGAYEQSMEFPEAGYFELIVSLDDSTKSDFYQSIPIAVLPTKEIIPSGNNPRFGLSLPQAGRAFAWREVARLTQQLGLGNVKVPIWFDATTRDDLSPLISALDLMNSQQVVAIGVVDYPPPNQVAKFPSDTGSNLLDALDLPTIWQPLLDPVFQRITLHVREFQLGWDDDISLIYDSKLSSIMQNLRAKLAAYDPEAKMTLACDITSKFSSKELPNVNRYQYYAAPGLNANEISGYSEALSNKSKQRWVAMTTVDSSTYSCESSIVDLAKKMLALVSSDFPVGFFSSGTAKELFDEQGHPGIHYLPVRNLASWTQETTKQEPIEVVANHVGTLLHQSGRVDLLLFPPEGTYRRQRFWLGDNLKAVDVWGREVMLEVDRSAAGNPIIVPDNRWPILIKDINESLIRWQSAIDLVSKELAVTSAGASKLQVQLTNKENFPIQGTIRLAAPDVFHEDFVDVAIIAEPLETVTATADVLLRSDVAEGDAPIQLLVNLTTSKAVNFELERILHVGLPGIRISSKSHVTPDDYLVIDVCIENQSDVATSFDMMLFVPERARERMQLVEIKGIANRQFVIPNAKDLGSQPLRLRCEQVGSGRTINHPIRIAPEQP